MSMVLPPNDDPRDQWRVSYAKTTAAKRGWLPPLAWDDIDRDPEPHISRDADTRYPSELLLAEWEHFRSLGESIEHAARRLGVTVKAIEKALERERKREDVA
jgi:hypothetical protein